MQPSKRTDFTSVLFMSPAQQVDLALYGRQKYLIGKYLGAKIDKNLPTQFPEPPPFAKQDVGTSVLSCAAKKLEAEST